MSTPPIAPQQGFRFKEKWTLIKPLIPKALLFAGCLGFGYLIYWASQNESEILSGELNQRLSFYFNAARRQREARAALQQARDEPPAADLSPEAHQEQLAALSEQCYACDAEKAAILDHLCAALIANPTYQDLIVKNDFPFHSFLLDVEDTITNNPSVHLHASRVIMQCCLKKANRAAILSWDFDPLPVLLSALERERKRRFFAAALPFVLQSIALLLEIDSPNSLRASFAHHAAFLQVLDYLRQVEQDAAKQPDNIDLRDISGVARSLIETVCWIAASDPSVLGAVPLTPEQIQLTIDVVKETVLQRLSLLDHAPESDRLELPRRVIDLAATLHHLRPDDAETLSFFGAQLTEAGYATEGRFLLRQSLKVATLPAVQFLLAQSLAASNREEEQAEAIALFQELRDFLKKNHRHPAHSGPQEHGFSLFAVLWHLGKLFEQIGRMDDAIEAIRASTRSNPDSIQSHLKLAALLLRGAPKRTQIESALVSLNVVLGIDPRNYNAFLLLAKAHELLEQDDVAIEYYHSAAKQKPAATEPYRRLALNYHRRNKVTEELAALRRIIDLNSIAWDAHYDIAKLHAQTEGPFSPLRLNSLIDILDAWIIIVATNPEFFKENLAAESALAEITAVGAEIESNPALKQFSILNDRLQRLHDWMGQNSIDLIKI